MDLKAEWSADAMGACWGADLVYKEAVHSIGQSGCEKVYLMVAWSVARSGETKAAD